MPRWKTTTMHLAVLIALSVLLPRANAEVLLIGDSHTAGAFGAELAKKLQDWSGNLGVDRFAVVDASATTWAQPEICPTNQKCPYHHGYYWEANENQPVHTYPWKSSSVDDASPEPIGRPGFAALVKKPKYSSVVIALGTNDANNSACRPLPTPSAAASAPTKKSAAGSIVRLLGSIPKETPAKPCVWVGPPAYTEGVVIKNCGSVEKYQAWVAGLQALVESGPWHCKFVRDPNAPAKGEVHFDGQSARATADLISQKIIAAVPRSNRGTGQGQNGKQTQ